MLQPIADFLEYKVSERRFQNYAELLDAMEVYCGDGFNTIALSIIAQEESHTAESLLGWFDATIGSHLDYYVSDYGVIARYANLSVAKDILESLFLIERYDDYETILSIVEDENEDNQSKYALVLEHLFDKKYATYIEFIDHVSSTFIRSIKTVMRNKRELFEEYPNTDTSLDVIRKRIIKFPNFQNTYIYEILKSGAKLGFDLEAMLNLNLEHIRGRENFIDELIAMIIASNEGPETFLSNREKYIFHLGLPDESVYDVMAELIKRLPNYAT